MYRCLIGLTVLFFAVSPSIRGQERCGKAKDYVVQAREIARHDLGRKELEGQRQQLKRATELCPSLGDAYYYRHLFAKQLSNFAESNYALTKARENGSEALRYESNPFIVTMGPDAKIAVSPTVREKWALVVGISKFRNRINPLKYSAKDATDFAALLQDPQYGRFKSENVRVLIDDEATTQRIKQELNWLARSARKDDLVVVFVSSHGSPREYDTIGVNYIVTYDTDASNQDSIYATALEMVEVVEALSTRVLAQRGVLFLDTCFSGAAGSGIRAIKTQAMTRADGNLNNANPGSANSKALTVEGIGVANDSLDRIRYSVGRVVIAASQPDERSWESESLKNGYFTYYLIEGLKQNNGKSSIEQLYGYLKEQVPRQVMAEKGISQTPMMLPIKPNVDISLGIYTRPH